MASCAPQSPREEAGPSSPQQTLPGIANMNTLIQLLNAGPPSPGLSHREGKQPESSSSNSSSARAESGFIKPAPDDPADAQSSQHLPTPPSEDSKRQSVMAEQTSPQTADPTTPNQQLNRQQAYEAYTRERLAQTSPYQQYPPAAQFPQQSSPYAPHPYHMAPMPYAMHYANPGIPRVYPHTFESTQPYAYPGYGEVQPTYHVTPHPQMPPQPAFVQAPAAYRPAPPKHAAGPPTEYAQTPPAAGYEEGDDRPARRRRGNLPKWATDYLKQWFYEHLAHPYPTEQEKQELCKITGLGMTQLSNWFINARRRQTPAMQAHLQAETSAQENGQPS